MRKLFPSRKKDHIPKKFNIWGDSDSDDDYKPEAESIPSGGGDSGSGGGGSGSDSDEPPKTPQKPKTVEKKDKVETDPFNARKVESEEAAPAAPSASPAAPLSPELQRVAKDIAKTASDPKILTALQSGKALERIGAKKDISTAAVHSVNRAVHSGALPRSKAAATKEKLSEVAITAAMKQVRNSTAGRSSSSTSLKSTRSSTSSATLDKSILETLNDALTINFDQFLDND